MGAPLEPPPPPPPQAIFALFELLKILGLVLAFGIAQLWTNTFGALFRWLAGVIDISVFGRHPLRFVANNLEAAASRVESYFGHLALAREPGFVTFLTWTGRVNKSAANEIAASSTDTEATLRYQQQVFTPWFVNTKTKPLTRGIGAATSTARAAGKTATKARAETKAVGKTATHTASVVAKAHVATLPQTIAHVNGRVGTLERWERTATRDLTRLKGLVAPLAFAGLVVGALTRLGMSWLRCPDLNKIGRKIGCHGFSWLGTFFADAFEALVVLDLCRFAVGAQRLARIIVPHLGDVLLVQDAVCLGGGASYPSAADHPTVTLTITKPSAHD